MTQSQSLDVAELTTADLLSLPPTVDVEMAGRVFGIGRSTAYHLAKSGQFPCKVIRAGRAWRVVTADMRRVLLADAVEETAAS